MVSGNSAYIISRHTAAMLTEGRSVYLEAAILELIGGNAHLGACADMFMRLGTRQQWSTADWVPVHEDLRVDVCDHLWSYDLGNYTPPAADSDLAEVFSAILADVMMAYWTQGAACVFWNTLTPEQCARTDLHTEENRLKLCEAYVPQEHFLVLRILDTDDDDCDFSDASCELFGCWIVYNAVQLTPAAEKLKRFMTEEWWAVGVSG